MASWIFSPNGASSSLNGGLSVAMSDYHRADMTPAVEAQLTTGSGEAPGRMIPLNHRPCDPTKKSYYV